MPLLLASQPAASIALCALSGSTSPCSFSGFSGSYSFRIEASTCPGAPVLSPCFPGFFTDSTSSQKSLTLLPLWSTTTPCFPACFTVPEPPRQETVSRELGPTGAAQPRVHRRG